MRPFDFPDVTAGELDNGLGLRVSRLARLPLTTVSLVLDAGETEVDPPSAGLAVLTGDALEGGTEARSGTELAEALEGIGATLALSTGWDATTASVSCLADRLDEALALLAEVTLRPSFPTQEIDRLKAQRLAAIQQRAMNPSSLAADVANELIYAEGSTYGRPLGGTTESVEAITVDAARDLVSRRYRPGSAGLVAVGDLDAAEVEEMALRHFGGWSGRSAGGVMPEPSARSTDRRIVIVDRPEAVQSEIRMGHIGLPKASEDYFALLVFNMILGGSFTSRLNLNLRERNGFTYGVRSRFAFRRAAGPFSVSTAVQTEVSAAAVRETLHELEALVESGPTEDETQAARDYIAGVFPLRLETTGQIAARIAELIVYDLSDDYHAHYRDRIRAVTKQDALEAGRRAVRPDELTIVVVGAAEKIRGPLEELDVGPVLVR
jgi:zinc protease